MERRMISMSELRSYVHPNGAVEMILEFFHVIDQPVKDDFYELQLKSSLHINVMSSTLTAMKRMRRTGLYTDFMIFAHDGRFTVHKCVLAGTLSS
jgi:hypothetical protein